MGALKKNFPDPTKVGQAIYAAGFDAATDALHAMRAEMGESKHGTHWPGNPQQSSAPGEAPAIQSGELSGPELHLRPKGNDFEVVSETPYAADLEFGTPNGRIAPRPFMVPAVHASAPQAWKRFRKALYGKKDAP